MIKKKTRPTQNIVEAGKVVAGVAVIAASALLEIIVDLAGCLGDIAVDRKAVYRKVYSQFPRTTDSQIAHQIYDLKARGLLSYRGDNQSIILTQKTKLRMLEYQSGKIERDNKFRFLSFDIPREKNFARNQFRRAIKRMGFVKIQQSLWVTDRDLADLVELAAYEFEVEKYIAYIISERSDIDGVVQKMISKNKRT